MTSASFARAATVTFSTKRPPAKVAGKRGAPVAHLTGLKCLPFYPAGAELRERLGLKAPMEILETFVQGDPDIVEGDIAVANNVEYPIRAVAEWRWPPDGEDYLHLVLEELKT